MTSTPPARRPRPTPRPAPVPRAVDEAALQARVDAFFAGRTEDETADRPPLFGRLRADARLRNRACLAAIGMGVALFVGASIETPLAGAAPGAAPPATATSPAPAALAPPAAPAAALPTARRTVPHRPAHVAVKAPTDARAISGLAANGIPTVALNAYRVAAARLGHVDPRCGIDWALLAGIGREESDHGRFGGAVLHADGVSTPAIVGPALDGVHWDYIPVSAEYVRVTGDSTFAHALGPMQFIPTTWAAYGADADGDGRADIFDINDAALGTARYLCAAGGNLRTRAGQVAGVLAYNHSDQYLAQVLALAGAYRIGLTVTGILRGNTTGSLPAITPGGYVPPANPGAPTAVGTSAGKGTTKKPAPKPSAPRSATASRTASPPAPSTGSTRTSGGRSTAPAAPGSSRPGSSSSGPGPAPSGSRTSSASATPTCHMALGGLCL